MEGSEKAENPVVIDWERAPLATHYTAGDGKAILPWFWRMVDAEPVEAWRDDGKDCPLVHDPYPHASRNALLRMIPRPVEWVEWDGRGLPPAGTVCLVEHPTQKSREVKILAHWDNGLQRQVAVYMPLEGIINCDQAIADCFRPIRTAEQIAADKEHVDILEMLHAEPTMTVCMAKNLHKAGYRKQVAQ